MTDIGKIHGAHHINPKEQPKAEEKCDCKECIREEAPKEELNLDADPNAAIGRSMVRTIKNDKGVTLAADYPYDVEDTREDTRDFNMVFGVAKEYAKGLIAEGCEPSVAADKAAEFTRIVLSHRNI